MTKVISYVFVSAYKWELFFYSRDADYFAMFYRINLKVYSAFFLSLSFANYNEGASFYWLY